MNCDFLVLNFSTGADSESLYCALSVVTAVAVLTQETFAVTHLVIMAYQQFRALWQIRLRYSSVTAMAATVHFIFLAQLSNFLTTILCIECEVI